MRPVDFYRFENNKCFIKKNCHCLCEIYQILRSQYCNALTLVFRDIKSAYDAFNRSFVWETLRHYISPSLLSLLRSLFDAIQIEVLLFNANSHQLSPKTGILQGSILSSYLYSVYLNQLPAQLRLQALTPNMLSVEMMPDLNCLLYANDIVFIAKHSNMVDLLQKCDSHSTSLLSWVQSNWEIASPKGSRYWVKKHQQQ